MFFPLKAALNAAESTDEKNTSNRSTLRLKTKREMTVFDLMNGDGACHGDTDEDDTVETPKVCLKGQFCASGSGSRINMFLGLPDPDPLVRDTDPDPEPSIIKQK